MKDMGEKPNKQTSKGKKRDETAAIIAGIFNLTPRQVRNVLNGDSENEKVLTAAIIYKEGKNRLIQEIEQLVPFTN
jgi:hypothetical protein